MTNKARGTKAGIIGMAGAILWAFTVFLQNRYDLFGLDTGPLYPVHQLLAFVALVGIVIGFWGLI
ncbi:MAG: hypothetical protein GY805_09810 [Chloroflexi bacterium]|nr:hypothetical protein [Chloroflexota bacterium]